MKNNSKKIKRSFYRAIDGISGRGVKDAFKVYFLVLTLGSILSLGTVRVFSPNVTFSGRMDLLFWAGQIIFSFLVYFAVIRKLIAVDREHYPKKRQRNASLRDYGILIIVLAAYFVFSGIIASIWISLAYGS